MSFFVLVVGEMGFFDFVGFVWWDSDVVDMYVFVGFVGNGDFYICFLGWVEVLCRLMFV